MSAHHCAAGLDKESADAVAAASIENKDISVNFERAVINYSSGGGPIQNHTVQGDITVAVPRRVTMRPFRGEFGGTAPTPIVHAGCRPVIDRSLEQTLQRTNVECMSAQRLHNLGTSGFWQALQCTAY